MSITSQLRDRAKNGYRSAPHSSTRPRLYGHLSTPDRFDLTDWQDKAHRANRLELTPRKGEGLGFGGIGNRLSGLPSALRNRRRKALRLRNWIRRDQAHKAANPDAAPIVAENKPAQTVTQKAATIARKVSGFFGRVLGRKGAR